MKSLRRATLRAGKAAGDHLRVNAMADKTSIKSAKVAKKAAARRVAAKATKPRTTAPAAA
jgi:hypothetical protein